jgi:hypothetical protein
VFTAVCAKHLFVPLVLFIDELTTRNGLWAGENRYAIAKYRRKQQFDINVYVGIVDEILEGPFARKIKRRRFIP